MAVRAGIGHSEGDAHASYFICPGVLLAARSHPADGKSVLYGRRTTTLTWALDLALAHRAE